VEAYGKAIDACMEDQGVDALIVIVLLQTPPIDERIIHVLTAATGRMIKPIVTVSVGGTYTESYRKVLESKGVPSYNSPLAAVKALERFVTYSRYRESLEAK
jgi:acetyltransferase